MPLTTYRRHSTDCPHKTKGRRFHRCDCPIWVQGSLGGEYVRESLNLTVWGAAQERIRGWEASGQVGVIKNEVPGVKEAIEKHIADAEARNLKPESLKGHVVDGLEYFEKGTCTHGGAPSGIRRHVRTDEEEVRLAHQTTAERMTLLRARARLAARARVDVF
jgi:hypothetical protein